MARKKKDGCYLNTKIKSSLMDKLERDYYFRHNKTVNDMFRNLKE